MTAKSENCSHEIVKKLFITRIIRAFIRAKLLIGWAIEGKVVDASLSGTSHGEDHDKSHPRFVKYTL